MIQPLLNVTRYPSMPCVSALTPSSGNGETSLHEIDEHADKNQWSVIFYLAKQANFLIHAFNYLMFNWSDDLFNLEEYVYKCVLAAV